MDLDLSDCPFLHFVYNDQECVIQTSHVTYEELMSIPGMGRSLWSYEKTTNEAIPLFWYADDDIDILSIVDINIKDGYNGYWVTPKGFLRDN